LNPELEPHAFGTKHVFEGVSGRLARLAHYVFGRRHSSCNGERKRQICVVTFFEIQSPDDIVKAWLWIPVVNDTNNLIAGTIQLYRFADAVNTAEKALIEPLAMVEKLGAACLS
jgi:hypothetical protein